MQGLVHGADAHNLAVMEPSEDVDATRVLPPEMLQRVFSFLGVIDRLTAGLACKKWHELATDGRLYTDLAFLLEEDVEERMTALARSSSVITWLIVKKTTPGSDAEFWERVGKTLKKLEFKKCDFHPREFVSLLMKCPKLEQLTISDCRGIVLKNGLSVLDETASVTRSALARISALDLSNNRSLTDAAFHQLVTGVGSLTTLSLEGCALCVHSATYHKLYPPIGGHSRLLMTFQDVLETLITSGARLKVVNLSRAEIDNTSLAELSKAFSDTLQELHVASCSLLSWQGVLALCVNVPKLKFLNIALNRQIDDKCLTTICANLKDLEALNMSGCTKITSEGLSALAHLGKLRSAGFSNCSGCELQAFNKLFSSRPWPGMRTLDMSLCRMDDAVARCLAEEMVMLVSLDVSNNELLTDDAVQTIWTHLRLLRVLRMARCKKITDDGLYSPGNSESCEPASLAGLTGLKELSLNNCYLVSDKGVLAALYFRELTTLDLGSCDRLTAGSLEHIALHVPSLSKLVLTYCVLLDDEALAPVLCLLPRIKHIDIGGCVDVTDAFLCDAVQCRSLKYANVWLCDVTPGMIERASTERPDLKVERNAPVG